MRRRHPKNPQLILIHGDEWNGLPLNPKHAPYVESYLSQTLLTLQRAVTSHFRTVAIRFDMRLPVHRPEPDSGVISRFFEGLAGRIEADQRCKRREGKRVHASDFRYVWVRERSTSHHRHYHCCILLNGDAYYHVGSFSHAGSLGVNRDVNMASRIRGAWTAAMGCSWEQSSGLIHFPNNCIYHIDVNSDGYVWQFLELFKRVSYFSKADTKEYGMGFKTFGSSRH